MKEEVIRGHKLLCLFLEVGWLDIDLKKLDMNIPGEGILDILFPNDVLIVRELMKFVGNENLGFAASSYFKMDRGFLLPMGSTDEQYHELTRIWKEVIKNG